jgi:hypothetical protein
MKKLFHEKKSKIPNNINKDEEQLLHENFKQKSRNRNRKNWNKILKKTIF